MIKIHQLLKESLITYKENFTNIFLISLPILAIGFLGQYTSYVGNDTSLMLLLTIVIFIAGLAANLFFQPAVSRSIQKLVDTGTFSQQDAYAFQKENVWNWIVLHAWAFVYYIYKAWKALLAVAALVLAGSFFLIQQNDLLGGALCAIGLLMLAVVVVLNMPRFVLFQNVFFSKGGKPKDAVLESIQLGDTKGRDTWKIIITVFLFSLYAFIIFGVLFGLAFLGHLISLADFAYAKNVAGSGMHPTVNYMAMQVVSFVVSVLFVTPVLFMILAKGYNKIKNTASAPEVVAESNPQ